MTVTPEVLHELADDILANANDPEVAHSLEDSLLHAVIEAHCPEWVRVEVRRVKDADFERWCA